MDDIDNIITESLEYADQAVASEHPIGTVRAFGISWEKYQKKTTKYVSQISGKNLTLETTHEYDNISSTVLLGGCQIEHAELSDIKAVARGLGINENDHNLAQRIKDMVLNELPTY